MRPLIPLVILALAWCSAAAQPTPAKYVSADGAVALFLDGEGGGHLMVGDGLLFPLDAVVTKDEIEATIGAEVAVVGRFEGDALHLTLRQGDVEETLTMTRRFVRSAIPSDGPLLALLAFVPDTAYARLGGVGFVDLGAAQDVAAVPRPSSRFDLEAMGDEERARWTTALRRVQTGPNELRVGAVPMIASLDELLGFTWSDIGGALGYGQPPAAGLVIAADVDAERLGDRVARRGFARSEIGGITVWHDGEDGRVSLADREPGDPFVGLLGMAARIALVPGHLVGARLWSLTRDVVDAALGRYPTLADAPDYRTLARAAVNGGGVLIQAHYFGPLDVGFPPGDPFAALRDGALEVAGEGPALPPYGLALLADLQDGPHQVSLIALLYADPDTAAAAAEVLQGRLATFVDESVSTWGAQVQPPRVDPGEDGRVSVTASIRYDLDAATVQGAPPGGAFGMWLQAAYRRQFPLVRIGP
jgi:hypothetical protein